MIISPITDIIRNIYYLYAEDTQIYVSMESYSNMNSNSAVVEKCVHEIKMWMRHAQA